MRALTRTHKHNALSFIGELPNLNNNNIQHLIKHHERVLQPSQKKNSVRPFTVQSQIRWAFVGVEACADES